VIQIAVVSQNKSLALKSVELEKENQENRWIAEDPRVLTNIKYV
jgi:hypothetical protein